MTAELPRKIVAIVDDDTMVRSVLAHLMKEEGYSVLTYGGGLDALDGIRGNRPDLVLLDINLPDVDGWTFLGRLRELPDPPPVIIVSSRGDADSARRAGAVAWVPKPFAIQALLVACARYCRSQEAAAN
jgi:DNA-binding response OmpR family regulator